jgi:hypothetical protein
MIKLIIKGYRVKGFWEKNWFFFLLQFCGGHGE